ncbi:hypothetical protein K7640_10665 [Micromonospora sp. PLK6-60]|uniref:hypothetical protein n=1 Tax=Micromonospora sp. PLK6-60 TaxID=2873383 RepID=UPI001CA77325|nr:hypothetical protein [Micromonospora sp. PLK6-60]MBY8872301.1 hypothetical protein [Micromonospora sp. PLK6-60]
MAETDSTGSTWRYRWAHRQNERRQAAYRATAAAWQQRDEELRRLRTLAAELRGTAGGGLPVELTAGELVFWTQPAAQLVEVRHTAVLPAPDLAVEPAPAPLRPRRPDGVKVLDAGLAVLTNRRLVLLGGRGRRDWSYAKLTGLAHDPAAPVTLLQVLDRRGTSGLLLPPAAAAEFRFTLTLAFAEAIEQRDTVIARLDELIAEHGQRQPFRPAIITPAQARLSARVPGGRRTVAVAAAAALIIPAVLLESDPPARTDIAVAATPAPTHTATGLAPAGPAGAKSKPKSKSKPSATPSGDGRCGAPRNPLGYTFCGGDQVRKPPRQVCDHFDCAPGFWKGKGFLVQCRDGQYSLNGGRPGVCLRHDGVRRTVYAAR